MLPIPDRIIGSKQLFIPLAYIGVTVTLCYYFLIAFAQTQRLVSETQQEFYRRHHPRYPRVAWQNPHHHYPPPVQNLIAISTADAEDGRNRPNRIQDFKRASEDIRDKVKKNQDHGTRRSEPTKIRHRHQDSPQWINLTAPMYFPWPKDESCQHFSVRFANNYTFRPRALVSYPGSGNSWLRYLLDGCTGVFTGSVFLDRSLSAAGLLGEDRDPNDGSTIVQKTHHDTLSLDVRTRQSYAKLTELMFGYRGILLIRSPYDAIRSHWNFWHTLDHKGHAGPKQFSLRRWKSFVKEGAERWAHLIESWLENSLDYLIVVYEKLQAEPRTELMRIMEYLDLPVDKARMACVLAHIEGPFHREDSRNQAQLAGMSFINSHLDLIVEQSIERVNRVFDLNEIPIRLNYTSNDSI